MKDNPLILAIDQGTGSTKCLLVDSTGEVVRRSQIPISQATPNPGWVEQDAEEIWKSIQQAIAAALTDDLVGNVVSVGFSTQREACVIWDRKTGEPVTPLLSWQDQRTAGLCEELSDAGHAPLIREKSGLPLDPMFSAVKAKWLLDQIDPDRVKAKNGDLCIGTVDAFVLSRMGGEPIIEAGNASRTQLVDVEKAAFDADLLDIFDIPAAALPRIVPSVGPLPATRDLEPLPNGTPVGAVLGDSHAALFAHGALEPGPIKVTHGTGSSVMGLDRRRSQPRRDEAERGRVQDTRLVGRQAAACLRGQYPRGRLDAHLGGRAAWSRGDGARRDGEEGRRRRTGSSGTWLRWSERALVGRLSGCHPVRIFARHQP